MRGKKTKSSEQKWKRRYRFFQCGFFILLMALGVTVYANYDYWVFKILIADHYVFTDALETLYAESIGVQAEGRYHSRFDQMVMAVVTEKIRSINQDAYTYLYTPQSYKVSKETEKADAKTTRLEALSDDTVYLYLPNISELSRAFVYDHKETLARYPNLILDMRGNYGGLLNDFYRIANLLVPKGTVLGYEQMRLPLLSHAVVSKRTPYFHFNQIIVLQDRYTASAAEGLILALKQHGGNVTLMGETTYGKGIGQVTIPLTKGYALRATVLLVQGPDGESIHRQGIAPDWPIAEGEDAVQAALAHLREY